jgi:hypothetical protein
MKNISKVVSAGLVVLGLFTTTVSADVVKGQKLYSKKLKKSCGLTGAKMATKYTQDEWESIMENGKLNEEIKNICGKETKSKYLEHLYDFLYEYASDSGNVPSC